MSSRVVRAGVALASWLLLGGFTSALGQISGVVIDGSNSPIQGVTVSAGGSSTTTDINGNYTLPSPGGTTINQISYIGPQGVFPGFEVNLSGTRPNVINKVLLRSPGPEGFERNLTQWLAFEQIFYMGVAQGSSLDDLRRQYSGSILAMPDPAFDLPALTGVTPVERQLLQRKRQEIVMLYGIRPGAKPAWALPPAVPPQPRWIWYGPTPIAPRQGLGHWLRCR